MVDGSSRSPQRDWRHYLPRSIRFASVLFLLLGVWILFSGDSDPGALELSYTDLRAHVDDGNIEEVTIVDGVHLQGDFNDSVERDGTRFSSFESALPGEISEDFLDALEAQGARIYAERERPAWWIPLVRLLPWVVILIVLIWFFRAVLRSSGQMAHFGRSTDKYVSPDTPGVTFSDVAGAGEAKADLTEIVDFLKDPARFSRLGGRLPKGVLLVGPPGTGKTLIARAVAGEAECPFFQISGSDFVEMFVGVGASRVRSLFEKAKGHAPAIVFIDELDAVGRQRGSGLGGGHDEREQTLNQLLVEMDGFEPNEGVILIAATNRPDALDPALLRPGRFDRQVVVDAPDIKGREEILGVHARELPLDPQVDLSALARGTPGFSGADLANLCNEAALLAARRGADTLSDEDFEQAKDKIMLGRARDSLVLSEDERRLTAYHEAGHAVVGLSIPSLDPVHKVTIIPRGQALGVTASLPEEDRHAHTRAWLDGQLAMLLAGRAAEAMTFGEDQVTTGAGNDIERATQIARQMVVRYGMSEAVGPVAVDEPYMTASHDGGRAGSSSEKMACLVDDEVGRLLTDAENRAQEILQANHPLLERLAQDLLDRESLTKQDLADLCNEVGLTREAA